MKDDLGDLDLERTDYDAPADPPNFDKNDLEDLKPAQELNMTEQDQAPIPNAPMAPPMDAPIAPPVAPPAAPAMATPEVAPVNPLMPTGQPAPAPAMPKPGALISQIINPSAQEMNLEDLSWAKDLANRHIKPKTYKDLFQDNSTSGKIGMLFGVIMGGIGSGLTHQPNAALQMMDKILERDFEAQKSSKENANNFLRTEYAHQMHIAQKKLLEAQAAGIPLQNKQIMAKIKDIDADSELKSQTATMNKLKITAMQEMQDLINNLPGDRQPQGQNFLDTVIAPKWTADIQKANEQTAAQLQARAILRDQKDQPSKGLLDEQRFQAQQMRLRLAGMDDTAKDRESRYIPELGFASLQMSEAEKNKINTGISFQNQLQGFINWSREHEGSLSPAVVNEGKALAGHLSSAYREAIKGGVYKEGEQGFIGKIIDEDPTKFFNEMRTISKLLPIQRETRHELEQLIRSKGFLKKPTYRPSWEKSKGSNEGSSKKGSKESAPAASKKTPPDGTKGTTASGVEFMWKDGKRREILK